MLPLVAGPRQPAPTVTALELPYQLVTSPIEPAHWRHSPSPVEHRGRTELWHTRLTTSKRQWDRTSRAAFARCGRPTTRRAMRRWPHSSSCCSSPDLIRMSLDPLDRSMLVTLMAGYDATVEGGGAYQPLSSEAKRLHLSALGALIDAEGTWTTTPDDVDLEQWRHLATLGRDHYVRVMYAGFLWPFGHAASLIKVTERKFESLGGEHRDASRSCASASSSSCASRCVLYGRAPHARRPELPVHADRAADARHARSERAGHEGDSALKHADMLSALYAGGAGAAHAVLADGACRAAAQLADVPFEIRATDIAGQTATFAMPLLFVGKIAEINAVEGSCRCVQRRTACREAQRLARRRVVSYAPSDPSDKGDPRLPTRASRSGRHALKTPGETELLSGNRVAEVGIKPIQKLLSQPNFFAEVTYPDFYKTRGFTTDKNKGRSFSSSRDRRS